MNKAIEFIRDCRGGMSYRKFADTLEADGVAISYRSIAHWENGEHRPSKSRLSHLAESATGYGQLFCKTILSLLKE